MPPKLVSDNGQHIVIRPLAYVKESDLIAYADVKQFPIIPCTLCGSQENLQRKQMNIMLRDWETNHPGRVESTFNALSRTVPAHLLDPKIFDFIGLQTQATPFEGGDIAFDEVEGCGAPALNSAVGKVVQWV
jgi:tRNA 2-thiocytidine biosynthesis protein TtcA